jgi:hypothetical protein
LKKLHHYQYQRLAVRLRIAGSPDRAAFARDGVQSRAFRQTFIAKPGSPTRAVVARGGVGSDEPRTQTAPRPIFGIFGNLFWTFLASFAVNSLDSFASFASFAVKDFAFQFSLFGNFGDFGNLVLCVPPRPLW